jgi:hypothetical protein
MFADFGEALLVIPYLGYGDILYHTPLIRILSRIYKGLDVWTFNTEPLLNNPYIKNLWHITNDKAPLDPWDFYFEKIFMTGVNNSRLTELYPSNFYTPEYFTAATIHSCLTDDEKHLTLNWKETDYFKEIVNQINTYRKYTGELVVAINPSIGWPSRTLPFDYYKEIIRRITGAGDLVVLIGKEINPGNLAEGIISDVSINERKSLYPTEELLGERVLDLTNKLTLEECAAVYSICDIALNTENGNMVISGCNENCWNLYIPMLTAPEFRIPWRKGSQGYRTYVVHNDEKYYPGSDYRQLRGGYDYIKAKSLLPSIEQIWEGYLNVRDLIWDRRDYAN